MSMADPYGSMALPPAHGEKDRACAAAHICPFPPKAEGNH